MMREYGVLEMLSALSRTATATGSGIDLLNYINTGGREMKAYLNVGSVSSSASPEDTLLDVKIQESADDSVWADISGATFTQVTSAIGAVAEQIHFQTNLRYIRVVGTQSGTTDVVVYGVFVLAVLRESA